MPVIISVAQDPTDFVIKNEQMRSFGDYPQPTASALPILAGDQSALGLPVTEMVACDEIYSPLIGGYPVSVADPLRSVERGALIASNSVIATPCGALIDPLRGRVLMNDFTQMSKGWALTGVTRDSTGAALGNCSVIAVETGRMTIDGSPIMAMGTSDGSGNFSLPVPHNVAHQVIGYLPGSPDVAGLTVNTLTPS